jgi:hypothetical protein
MRSLTYLRICCVIMEKCLPVLKNGRRYTLPNIGAITRMNFGC